jgi:ATP-dependent Clp protease ATP-binding subunit ClpA
VSKLFGPPPGYVGYPSGREGDPKDADPSVLWKETQGMISGGILLLDEVEKAHPDMWDSFLTIFDEGYAKTSVGNIVDFRNTIIVMTTNLGTQELEDAREEKKRTPIGFSKLKSICVLEEGSRTDSIKEVKKTALEAAKEYMKPELLGRITAIVPFLDLSVESMKAVVDLEWAKASEYIADVVDVEIDIHDTVKQRIAEVSSSRGSGARLVSRLVEAYIVDPLAELHVENASIFSGKKYSVKSTGQNSDGCDTVKITYGKKTFDYEVTMTLGDIDE